MPAVVPAQTTKILFEFAVGRAVLHNACNFAVGYNPPQNNYKELHWPSSYFKNDKNFCNVQPQSTFRSGKKGPFQR